MLGLKKEITSLTRPSFYNFIKMFNFKSMGYEVPRFCNVI